MARGRFISNTLGESDRFAALDDWAQRALYMMLVTHADCEGRLKGNPRWIAGKAITYLDYPGDEDGIEKALAKMHEVGLIVWYRANGNRYIYITKFHEHNKVRRSEDGTPSHESPSQIPAPPSGDVGATESLRSSDVAAPLEVEVEVQEEVEDEGSAEARFHRLATTGTSEQAETARVRTKLTRTAGRNFARFHEDDLPAWSRWTNDQIEAMWDAAQPSKWDGNAATKTRAQLFEDLLNERRTPPGAAQEPPHLALIRKYQGVQGVKDGKQFEVVGADINGQMLMTDVAGYLTPAQVEEARQCLPN